jgi:hypothetical protein
MSPLGNLRSIFVPLMNLRSVSAPVIGTYSLLYAKPEAIRTSKLLNEIVFNRFAIYPFL